MTGLGPRPLIDISIPAGAATPPWPGDAPFVCGWSWSLAKGDSVNVSTVSTSPHVGTHADAPFHVDSAWQTAESLPLDVFAGPAVVVDLSTYDGALGADTVGALVGTERLLVRTGRSIATGTFPASWPWLADDALDALLRGGLRLLGVDAPSVDDRESKALTAHRTLFSRGAFVLENLDLRRVSPGRYHLSAYPVCWAGTDAAPVRAVLTMEQA